MNDLYNSKKLLWSLLAAFVIAWLAMLGLRTLVPPDEGRYAEMAREMLQHGDWITTRLNGIKYFEKPPLQTWMNALTFAAFGLGEWQARLWTGLCGIGAVLLSGYTGRRLFSARAGFYAALVLGSSMFWVAGAQINSLDMSLSGMMATCLAAIIMSPPGRFSMITGRPNRSRIWVTRMRAMLSPPDPGGSGTTIRMASASS